MRFDFKTFPLRWYLVVLLLVPFILVQCTKQSGLVSHHESAFINESKSWFKSGVVDPEKDVVQKTKGVLPAKFRLFMRMRKLDKLLSWDDAETFSSNGVKFVVVPVDEPIQPFENKNFEGFRHLVIQQSTTGSFKMNIIEVISNKGSSLGKTPMQISAIAFKNHVSKAKETLADVSATVIIYDKLYQPTARYQFLHGTWGSSKNSVTTTQRRSKIPVRTVTTENTCLDCTTWYTILTWYDTYTGEVVSSEILSEEEVCTGRYVPYGGQDTGEDPEEPEEPPMDTPCKRAKYLTNTIAFGIQMNNLYNARGAGHESLYTMKPAQVAHTYQYYNGGPGGINYNFTMEQLNGVTGIIHNHEISPTNLSIFSEADFKTMFKFVTGSGMANPEQFIFGLVSPNGTGYMLAIDDIEEFHDFAAMFDPGNEAQAAGFNALYNLYISTSNTPAENEANFVSLLEQVNGGTGLTLMKSGIGSFSNWATLSKNAEGNIVITPCP